MNVIIDISNKRWLSEDEAVLYTTFGKDSLRNARDLHQLPYRKFGKRRIVYERVDLDDFMEKLEHHKNGKVKKTKNK